MLYNPGSSGDYIVLLWGWKKKKRNLSKTSSVFRSFFFSFVIGAMQLHHKSPDSHGWQHHGGPVEKLSKQPDRTKLHDKQRCHVEFLPSPKCREMTDKWANNSVSVRRDSRAATKSRSRVICGREVTLTTRCGVVSFSLFTFASKRRSFACSSECKITIAASQKCFLFNWTVRFCFKGPLLCKSTSPPKQ